MKAEPPLYPLSHNNSKYQSAECNFGFAGARARGSIRRAERDGETDTEGKKKRERGGGGCYVE